MFRSAMTVWIFVLAALATAGAAQTLTLSPAVVPLGGSFGQSTTQELTLHNGGTRDLDFHLEALDVVVREGRRVFVEAGELPDSIAATAVFAPRATHIPAGQSRSVTVTLTVPPAVRHRAVVVLFRSQTPVDETGRPAYLSLGTLFTFTLTDETALAVDLRAHPPTSTANLRFLGDLVNEGREPVELRGMAVLLDASGALVGKTALPVRRLLPGERTQVSAEHAGALAPGSYRAVVTFDFAGRAVTRATELTVR